MKNLLIFTCLISINIAHAQFVFPKDIERERPRLISPKLNKKNILNKIESSEDTKKSYEDFKSNISKYVVQFKTDKEWLSSRFQMYRKSHAHVFVDRKFYAHAKGKTPIPTVRFAG